MPDIKDYRRNWEKISKMNPVLKVNRELGRFWALWSTIKQEKWTAEIEDKFATIAFDFFTFNPTRTVVDASAYKELLGDITKIADNDFQRIFIKQAVENLMVLPEWNDTVQLRYPIQFNDEPCAYWPTLREQLSQDALFM